MAGLVWRDESELLETGISMSPRAKAAMRASLLQRLAFVIEQLAEYEGQRCLRKTGGSTLGRQCPASAIFDQGVEHKVIALVECYPELERLWLTQITNWQRFFRGFRRHAAAFALKMRFGGEVRITKLEPDLSDLHNAGRSVIRVRFANGQDWCYKPRPSNQIKAWLGLLSKINRAGVPHHFKVPRLIANRSHHWLEAITPKLCRSRKQERDFWFRCGGLLYLINLLKGVDFHVGNLVCSGDQPVFIDCETLLHPETPMPRGIAAKESGIFRIGMLPLGENFEGSVASLGPKTFQQCTKFLQSGHAIAVLLNGFAEMHRWLDDSIIDRAVTWLRSIGCRIVWRPTARYHFILRESMVPTLLRDPVQRDAFLRQECRAAHIPQSVSDYEAAALKDGDIPLIASCCGEAGKRPSNSQLKVTWHRIATAFTPLLAFRENRAD